MTERPAPVMRPTYTPAEAREVLRAAGEEAGSLNKLAAAFDTSPANLHAYTAPRSYRKLSATIARQLGLKVVKLYVPRDTPL